MSTAYLEYDKTMKPLGKASGGMLSKMKQNNDGNEKNQNPDNFV